MGRASLCDQCHQVFLCFEFPAACNHCDLCNQRIVIKHVDHRIRRDLYEISRDFEVEIEDMGIGHDIARPVCPD